MVLGQLIKKRRKELLMTQKQLAEGICVQALISKIENEEVIPSDEKIKKIADRLNIPLEYFEDALAVVTDKTNQNDLNGIINTIREYLTKREYDTIQYLLDAYNEEIKCATSDNEIVFFEWIYATMYYYRTKDSEGALEKLKKIPLSEKEQEISVEIINAIGRIYYLKKEYSEAMEYFEKGMLYMSKENDLNYSVRVKLLFNYALTLAVTENYKKAMEVINNGIGILVKNNSLFLLGDFQYEKGVIFKKIGDSSAAEKHYSNAYSIFDIQNNEQFKNRTQIELNELKKGRDELC
ncbi:helix-turn-helix domain-containing protein [Alkalibacterium olivapovliticus]|uniref:Tetratricopeptide repeat protein n=1 Tax=Alkalibacterium olivapovliticus TaxID=99907 RepID=A0A2T0VTE9_9LACT|nr:helix-turn-helix domain-containing protein [Alkalibacterium olivapovliticus]PRY74219.1 tetratricopeptide repeat protein [Alkalibacterium olivapovliticus]